MDFGASELDFGTDNLTSAFATLFTRIFERALVFGVDRSYVEEEEGLVALRGRVDWPAQSRAGGLAIPVACRYDEWSIDTQSNRLSKAAAQLLLRQPELPVTTAHALRRLLALLVDVSPLGPIDLANGPQFTRLNQHYEGLVGLARLALRSAGTAHGPGAARSPAFLVNMNDVFEDFVFGRLSQALRGVLQVKRHRVVPLGTRREVPSEPDFIFTDASGRDVLVADAKYKLTNGGRGRSSDYYQLHAYCTSLGLPRGILIYCDAEGELPSRSVTVRNHGTVLETYRLGLSGQPEAVVSEVHRLVDCVKAAAAAPGE